MIVLVLMYVYLYSMLLPSTLGGQKNASGPLELESQAVASHHVGAENWTQNLFENKTLKYCAIVSPAPIILILNHNM